jgi:pimeloyl-ACP methyl ester carboxylesterase
MYYEIHGDAAGTPLVLLHGGGSSINVTYGRILRFMTEGIPIRWSRGSTVEIPYARVQAFSRPADQK